MIALYNKYKLLVTFKLNLFKLKYISSSFQHFMNKTVYVFNNILKVLKAVVNNSDIGT